MRVINDKNQISKDVFDFMISYLPLPQKSIRSELANFFSSVCISLQFRIQTDPNSEDRETL